MVEVHHQPNNNINNNNVLNIYIQYHAKKCKNLKQQQISKLPPELFDDHPQSQQNDKRAAFSIAPLDVSTFRALSAQPLQV
jgi:hypothetical protein